MKTGFTALKRFLQNEDGPTAVEYAVMLAFIILVCITVITRLGTTVSQTYSNTDSILSNVS